ncbi:MAG: M1 family metallopeptidase [Melioribacteraceae bacterium]|nr:M1 family metallopeptidase [Melioribacteraceae bacterium]
MELKKFILFFVLYASCISGKNYFQQGVSYKIDAELNPENHTINLKSEITYVNNSPDTLTEIFIRLHWNIFRNDSYARQKNPGSRVYYSQLTNGIQVNNVTLNDQAVINKCEIDNTIMKVPLDKNLLPGESVRIMIDAEEEVPESRLRTGRFERDYCIAHWFPAVCVYDKQGWQTDQYLGQGEFNEEIGNYEVNLTLPSSFLVFHTGYLLNESEVLSDSVISNLRDAEYSGKLTRIINQTENKSEKNDEILKLWKLKADSVRTFAFAALENRIWDACYYNNIRINTVYSPYNEVYYTTEGMKAAKHVVKYLSENIGRYPYPNVFVVGSNNIGGGMEYPGITFVSGSPVQDMFSMIQSMIIIHEIIHNWCPMTINSNETKYAFMDEGMTDYWTMRAMEELYGRDFNFLNLPGFIKSLVPPLTMHNTYYNIVISDQLNGLNEPVLTHSDRYKNSGNYSLNSYQKTTLILVMLRYVMGNDASAELFRELFDRFRFKHIYPGDFVSLAEEINFKYNRNRDLSWFFDGWFNKTYLLDYSLNSIDYYFDAGSGKYLTTITVERLEDAIMPCDVAVKLENGTSEVVTFEARDFLKGISVVSKTFEFDSQPGSAEIDPDMCLLDVNRLNNYSSVFPPVSVHFNTIMDFSQYMPPDKYFVTWFPAFGFNNTDGFRLGLNLKGSYLGIGKNFEFNLLQGMKFAKNSLGGDFRIEDKLKVLGPLAEYSVRFFNYEGRRGGNISVSKYFRQYTDYPEYRFKLSADYFDAYDDNYFNAAMFDKMEPFGFRKIKQRKYFWFNTGLICYNNAGPVYFKSAVDYESGFTIINSNRREGFQKLTLELTQNVWLPELGRLKLRQYLGYSPLQLPSAKSYYLSTVNPVDEFSSFIYRTPGIISDRERKNRSVPNGGGYLRGYYNQNNYGDVITAINAEVSASFLVKFIPVVGNFLSRITWLFADAGNVWKSIDNIAVEKFLYDYGFSVKIPLRANVISYTRSNPFEFLNKLGINSINFDFPLYISDPPAGEKKFEFRWLFGFQSPL